MNFLKLMDVHHTYFTNSSATTALTDISLEIEEGEFVSFSAQADAEKQPCYP